jgi:2',3'-cyclic-nucleotide 2'-phosphodiesterase/3'-nucleotidase
MKGPGDRLLKFRLDNKGRPVIRNGEAWLRNQPYNFDSAVGIDYTVDVRRKEGDRIVVKSFSDGKPFEPDRIYTVAINSYRGNGGGGHLTAGAGIPKDELPQRLIRSTEKDLRYYILKDLEEKGKVHPFAYNNWKIIPEKWASKAKSADYDLLFGK